jgi:restriction endonuclease S subunit
MAFYNNYKEQTLNGGIALATDTIKVALLTSSYIPDIDAHANFSDLTNEVVGTGYTSGGKTLTTPVVSQDNTNNLGKFDADDVTWASSTLTARYAVAYKDTGTPATSALISYIDFGSDKSSSAGDFIIQWNASGIINVI